MSFDVKQAIMSWENEVDTETARLIEKGFAPYEAAQKARVIVSTRRRMKYDAEHSKGSD